MVDAVVPSGLKDEEVASFARMKRPDLFGAPAGVPRPDAITNPAQNPAQRYAANPWQVKEPEPGFMSDAKLGGQITRQVNDYAVKPFERMASMGKEVGGAAFETMAKRPSIEAYGMPQTPSPAAVGIAKGVGEAAGGMVADPRNWPFLGSGAAKPLLQRAMSLGFSGMMAKGSYDTAKSLHDNWDSLTPTQRWTMGTEGGVNSVFAAMSAAHGVMPHPDVISGKPPEGLETPKGEEVKTPPPANPVPPEANAPDPVRTAMRERATKYSTQDIYEGRVPDSPLQTEANARMATRNKPQVVQGFSPDTPTPTPKLEESPQTPGATSETTGPVRSAEGPPVDQADLDAKLADYNKTVPQHLDAFAQAKEKLGPDATMSQVLQEAAKIQNGGPKEAPPSEAKVNPPDRSTGFLGGYKPGATIGQRAYWGVRKVNVLSRDENGSFTVKLPGGEIQKGVDSSVLSEDPNLGQAGFIGFGRKPKPINNPVNSIQELTQKVDQGLKDTADPSMSYKDKLVDRLSGAKDSLTEAMHSVVGTSRLMWENYKNPPIESDYKSAVGKWQGNIQRSAFDTHRFAASIKDKFPDKLRREAITNYIQADGDVGLLSQRENLSMTARLKKGYNLAQQLTPEEKDLAHNVRTYFVDMLVEAQKHGLLDNGIANYVNQVWKRPNPVSNKLMGMIQKGILQPKPSFTSQRIFDSYFDGEQLGHIPRDKDVGFLLSTYEQSFSTALGSRGLIHELTNGNAKDGRPIVSPSGGGHTISDPQTGDLTYLISPRVRPDDTADYRPISHPALSKWTWADKDESGNPIFVKGDLLVHPDHYSHLNGILGPSPIRSNPVGRAVLNIGGFLKGTFLVGPFHQVQEGVHAVFHGVNPFKPRDIDFNDATQSKLVDHGLMLADFHAQQDFAEGAAVGGLWNHIPGIGPMLQKYNEYLFQDYIPRLKMTMATDALERNQKRYPNLSESQVHELTANQANAAFGELNYRMLGRSKLTQDVMRLTMLAPDFLEARMRFNAQALSPYGREQGMALVMRGALGMWLTARITNKLLDDDYHFDQPFSIVHDGHTYTLRSLPGDDWHLFNDPRSFVYHRLNPFTTRPVFEALTGRDDFGRPRKASEQLFDYVKTLVPLPAQGLLNKYGDTDIKSTLLESAGIRRDLYRSPAQKLAHKFAMDNLPMNYESRGLMQMANKIQQGGFKTSELRDAVSSGKMTVDDINKVYEYAQTPPLVRDFKELKDPSQAAQVYIASDAKEKAQLQPDFLEKMNKIYDLPPAKQQEAWALVQRIMKQN